MFNRSQLLFMLGLVLMVVGAAVAFAVRFLTFARYMRLEDLGLDVDPAVGADLFALLVAPTAAERTFFYLSVGLVPVGLVLLIVGWRLRSRPAR